ncbi:MAG: hypothetical protein AAFQ82_00845 [Myxococcota bacterium]
MDAALLDTDGDTTQWTQRLRISTSQPLRKVHRNMLRELEQHWTLVSQGVDSQWSKSVWTFKDREGLPWRGEVTLRLTAPGRFDAVVSVHHSP